MQLRRYRPAALLMLSLHLSGCYKWEPIPPGIPPGPVIESEEPSEVRVTLIDGSEARIDDPVATVDSIYDPAHRGYALEEVTMISLRRDQTGGTFLLFAAGAAALVGVYFLLLLYQGAKTS